MELCPERDKTPHMYTHMRRLVWPLGTALLLGCNGGGEAGGGSTTDEVTSVRDGDAIDSRYANEDGKYLTERGLFNLGAVGALEGVVGALARRANELSPTPDDFLDLDELLHLESPAVESSLSSAEKAARATLWSYFEISAEPVSSLASPSLTALATIAETERETTLHGDTFVRIDDLRSEVHELYRRVQQSHDHDQNADTIDVADLRAALENPGVYTAAEREQMQGLEQTIVGSLRSDYAVTLNVPKPGVYRATLAEFGDLALDVDERLQYLETRRFETARDSNVADFSLRAAGTRTLSMRGRNGELILVASLEGRSELLLQSGNAQPAERLPQGDLVVECWKDGRKTGSKVVHWNAEPTDWIGSFGVDLSQYFGDELVADGEALSKRPLRSYQRTGSGPEVYALYAWGEHDQEIGERNRAAEDRLSFGYTEPGRYPVKLPAGEQMDVDVARSGVVHVTLANGTRFRMLPTIQRTSFGVSPFLRPPFPSALPQIFVSLGHWADTRLLDGYVGEFSSSANSVVAVADLKAGRRR